MGNYSFGCRCQNREQRKGKSQEKNPAEKVHGEILPAGTRKAIGLFSMPPPLKIPSVAAFADHDTCTARV
jgi:hypothetical protein